MVTNPERMEAVYNDTYLLILDKKLAAIEPLIPFLNQLKNEGIGGLTIVASDIEQGAINALVQNKMRGVFNSLVVKAPGYGAQTRELLEDLAVLTGATVITEESNIQLHKMEKKYLGKVRKVISKQDKTTFIGGNGTKEDIKERVDLIKGQLEHATGGFDTERLQERLAKLTGGVAVMRVGAPTETEMKYLKLKLEDAVNATKAAVDSGIVLGGGMALYNTSLALASKDKKKLSSSERLGYEIVIEALQAPLRQILKNADIDPSVIEDVTKNGPKAGFDAKAGKVVKDMFKAGIIDPVLVTRTALERASSVAALAITTETVVAYVPQTADEKKS